MNLHDLSELNIFIKIVVNKFEVLDSETESEHATWD